jgi:hypothetical protein
MHTENRVSSPAPRPAVYSAWFPPADGDERPVHPGSTMPHWALDQFVQAYDPTFSPVRCFRPPRHEALRSPRPALANRPAPGQPACLRTAVALIEPEDLAAMTSEIVLLQFLRRLRTVLAPGGVLAVHTRTQHGNRRFTDPGGRIVVTARNARLHYLERVVLVHGRPQTEPVPLSATESPHDANALANRHRRPRPVHTDLYLFTTPEWKA